MTIAIENTRLLNALRQRTDDPYRVAGTAAFGLLTLNRKPVDHLVPLVVLFLVIALIFGWRFRPCRTRLGVDLR